MIVLVKKKKLWELYFIKKAKDALNSRQTPKFIAYLKFKRKDSELELNKFIVVKNNEEKLQAPSTALKILRKQLVLLADKDNEMEKFLTSQDIKFYHTHVCKHCISEGFITIINSNFTYYHHGQELCKTCGEEYILLQLSLQGFSKKTFSNFKRLLGKYNDLDKVLSILNNDFDPIANSELTLFDRINVEKNKKIPKIAINHLKIPKDFKNVLDKNNDKYLLPIQYLSIKKGLLKGENLLVVSGTGSGKTLVGELAGVPKALKGEKFLFLTPLVALSNQKYRDFKEKYEALGLKIAIKVGMNRIKAKNELQLKDSYISNSDIVVGTYEGIDFLIRSGKYDELNKLGTVLIDEVHMLDDEDRGLRLNGLIRRLIKLFPQTQIIGLSATVKNQKQLATDFNLQLVEFGNRPVPLERHLVFLKNEMDKRYLIKDLILKESRIKSSKGYLGQTIIFTNSRRKTHQISDFLSKKRVNAVAYHAGLSYYKKESIEKNFSKGKISAVVTTAALAAGVDFPASQVIFESLLMGNKWLSPNEFFQMLGRAGRPTYHDRGIVYLLAEIANEFDGENEDAIAISLLESDVENINIKFNEKDFPTEILADISSKAVKNINEVYESYKDIDLNIDMAIDELHHHRLIKIRKSKTSHDDLSINKYNNEDIFITKYGRSVSISFLNIETADLIKKYLDKINENIKNNYKSNNNSNHNNHNNSKNLNNNNNNKNKNNKNNFNNFNNNKNNSKNLNNNKNNFKNLNNNKSNYKNLNINNNNFKNLNNNNYKNLNNNENIFNLKVLKNKKLSKIQKFIISDILELVVDLELFQSAYLSPNLHKHIISKLKTNFSSRLFAESTLDIISSGETIDKLDTKFNNVLLKIQLDFSNCTCKEKPFCPCLQINLSKFILENRLKNQDPTEISKNLLKHYQIQAYTGDVFSWLDTTVRLLDGIKRICLAFDYEKIADSCEILIKAIEG
ncbi:MAG: DUF5814 domain-containing protein [Methanobrevibacter sp.]|jgi:helicase|nr:DUF5814 domain-containing protein [Candidatus Methanovirga meridionalis]